MPTNHEMNESNSISEVEEEKFDYSKQTAFPSVIVKVKKLGHFKGDLPEYKSGRG